MAAVRLGCEELAAGKCVPVMLPKEPVPYNLGKEAQAWCGEPQRGKLLEVSRLAFLIVTSVLSPC